MLRQTTAQRATDHNLASGQNPLPGDRSGAAFLLTPASRHHNRLAHPEV